MNVAQEVLQHRRQIFMQLQECLFCPVLKVRGCSGRGMNYLEEEVKEKIFLKNTFLTSAVFGVKIYSS